MERVRGKVAAGEARKCRGRGDRQRVSGEGTQGTQLGKRNRGRGLRINARGDAGNRCTAQESSGPGTSRSLVAFREKARKRRGNRPEESVEGVQGASRGGECSHPAAASAAVVRQSLSYRRPLPVSSSTAPRQTHSPQKAGGRRLPCLRHTITLRRAPLTSSSLGDL